MSSDFALAVHALVYLGHRAEALTSEALAENICTNPARVRRVMARLKKAGLVETRGWREAGGYFFSRDPETVTLRMVGDALGACFVSAGWKSGDPHMECRVASGIAGVMDGVYADLDRVCRERLDGVTVADLSRRLFD